VSHPDGGVIVLIGQFFDGFVVPSRQVVDFDRT
jgi:hypothetical protein